MASITTDGSTAWPFFIICDTSKSMWGGDEVPTPYDATLSGLEELVEWVHDDVQATDIAHLSIISFSDEPHIEFPLDKVASGYVVPKLNKGTQTNYVKLFEFLSTYTKDAITRLEREYDTVKRPVLFLITDGQPYAGTAEQPSAEWRRALNQLKALHVTRPNGQTLPVAIVAFGFGHVRCETLREVSQSPGYAMKADLGGGLASDLLSQHVFPAIIDSVANSVHTGRDHRTPMPEGMVEC